MCMCMDILAIIPMFNCSLVCVNVCMCTCVLCAYTRILVLCTRVCAHMQRRGGMQKFSSHFTQPRGTSTIVSLLFAGGTECILIFSANMHRDLFLSGVTGLPTQCPAVMLGPSMAHRLRSPLPSIHPGKKRPRVEAPAATVSCGSTAWGFCLLLSCRSSYRNVVSWAATLLSNVNVIGQWEKKE